MTDHSTALVRRYKPRALDGRQVALPPEPWDMHLAEPLHVAPPPAEPTQSDTLRQNLDLVAQAVARSPAPISRAGVERATGLKRDYIDQLLRQLAKAGRIRAQKFGHLTYWSRA